MIRPFLILALFSLAASGPLAPAAAHDGHRRDMSNAEMAMENEASASHRESPAGESLVSPSQLTTQSSPAPSQATGSSTSPLADMLGRLHPFAAHFPMALLLVAAVAELAMALRPTLGMETTVRFLVAWGAIGGVATALLGWFSAGWRLGDRSETLALHRWNGTAIAAVSLLAWWAAYRPRRVALRLLLGLLAGAILIQGYLGGEMVFGPGHLGF